MKVLVPGHRYELDMFEDTPDDRGNQHLQFIHKELVGDSKLVDGRIEVRNSVLTTIQNGTTNEEVLAALIDRLTFLNNKFPCIENEQALLGLITALAYLEKRTKNRKERGVEGKHLV